MNLLERVERAWPATPPCQLQMPSPAGRATSEAASAGTSKGYSAKLDDTWGELAAMGDLRQEAYAIAIELEDALTEKGPDELQQQWGEEKGRLKASMEAVGSRAQDLKQRGARAAKRGPPGTPRPLNHGGGVRGGGGAGHHAGGVV